MGRPNSTRNLRSILACCIGLAFVALPAAPARSDVVYDASADFDPAHNPSQINGVVYSYGYTASLGSSFALLPSTFSGGILGGQSGSVSGYDLNGAAPELGKNTGNSVYTSTQGGSTVTVQPGQLILHPGSSGQYADLRFTAPATNSYSFNSVFNAADSEPTTTDVEVLVNNVVAASGGINVNGGGNSATLSSSSVALKAGDTIDFVVGYGNGSNSYDSTGLYATVTQLTSVPEPGPLALCAVAAAGFLLATRRPSSR